MRTITFYSYKGGVGRSLLVANAARYLSTLGKSVFALDLDLEAPGLHYKFELGTDAKQSDSKPGIVDILVGFLKSKSIPISLADYISTVNVAEGAGPISVMRAGIAPQGAYWRLLSQINWYEIFYGPRPIGAPFFLELKERIRLNYKPDFLLIDARTGITEMGGIATTLLPDTVVCLALASPEHLDGLRAVMQGIEHTTAHGGEPVKLLPVISRLPQRKDEDLELESVRSFLNTPLREGAKGLDLDEVMALHSEPFLDAAEQVLVGGKNSPHDLPLLRDYLRLFSKIIPAEEIRPYVGQLIQRAVSRLLDDPDTAQSELEALTAYCADQEAYRALLKLYQVRKAPIDKVIATANLMWQLSSKDQPEQLLLDIVQVAYAEWRSGDMQKKHAEFAEAVFRSSGMKDLRVCMTLVSVYVPEQRERANQLLIDYIEQTAPPPETAIVRLIDSLRVSAIPQKALEFIERFKNVVEGADFHASWARVVAGRKDPALASELLRDPLFRASAVRASSPIVLYRIFKLTGDALAEQVLKEAVDRAVRDEDTRQLRILGDVFVEEGRIQELEARMTGKFPRQVVEEILESSRRRGRPSRFRHYDRAE